MKAIDEIERFIADSVGIEAANVIVSKLCKEFGGEMIYIPTKRATTTRRNSIIKAKFSGDNYRELAREYGLSTRYVRHIVATYKN